MVRDRCPKERTYTSAVKLTEDSWKCFKKPQKLALLKALKINKSWAETKSIKELVKRGGGFVAKDLLTLNKAYLARDGSITIRW